ncbi:Altronate oxidoreductase [Varanus komodoensis]|nr:Altronate oxidoreductase [Varanus komodoensis]
MLKLGERGAVRVTGHRDSMDKQKLKQDLLIAVMCMFLVLLIMLIAGCTFLHYKLMTEEITLKKELPSSIQAHCMETNIVLSPAQPDQSPSSEWGPALMPPLLPGLPQLGHVPPNPKSRTASISCLYRSRSSESIPSDEAGTIYTLERFQCLYGSSRSGSRESLDKEDQGLLQEEELEISNESGSVMLCAIHEM